MDRFFIEVSYPLRIVWNNSGGRFFICTECPERWFINPNPNEAAIWDTIGDAMNHAEKEHWNSDEFERNIHPVP